MSAAVARLPLPDGVLLLSQTLSLFILEETSTVRRASTHISISCSPCCGPQTSCQELLSLAASTISWICSGPHRPAPSLTSLKNREAAELQPDTLELFLLLPVIRQTHIHQGADSLVQRTF